MTRTDAPGRRTIVFLLVGVLVAGLTAGGCGLGRRPGRPKPGPGPGSGITNRNRNLAMFSIQAHAFWPDRNFHGAHFIPFDKAIATLRDDEGPGAASRVRRAVAKLWAYGYGRRDFHNAIKVLLEKYRIDFDAFDEQLAIESRNHRPPIPLPPPEQLKPLLENIIVNDLVGLTEDCPYRVPTPSGNVGHKPPPVTWSYDALIPRPVADIARSLDPQSWSLSSTYFDESYLVQTPASCCSNSPTPDCTFTPKSGTSYPQEGPRHSAGQPYGQTAFFESLCVGNGCPDCKPAASCDTSFKNLLCVGTSYDIWAPFQWLAGYAGSYQVTYKLATFLYGNVGGDESDDATIIEDKGTLSATVATALQKQGLPGNVWSLVHVDKELDFKSKTTGIGVGQTLQSLEAELRDQVVEQACFAVPVECWFSLVPP